MIDVNTPQSIRGIFLLVLFAFVIITALITTGILPVVVALVAAGIVLYLVYVVLMRIHRRFKQGQLRSGGPSE